MTGQRPSTQRRRLSDHGIIGWFEAWWWGIGQPILGVIVVLLGVGFFVVGLQVRHYNANRARDAAVVRHLAEVNARNQVQTAIAARQACQRALALGPSLAQDYRIRHVLTGANLRLYEHLIPKSCPTP